MDTAGRGKTLTTKNQVIMEREGHPQSVRRDRRFITLFIKSI
jgi:hypothetical protein